MDAAPLSVTVVPAPTPETVPEMNGAAVVKLAGGSVAGAMAVLPAASADVTR